MDFFRHLPQEPEELSQLIQIRPGRVLSKTISQSQHCQLMLMAVSSGEEILAEEYPGDTLYYVLEGTMPLYRDGICHRMEPGQVEVVPRGVAHAIGGAGDFKILQIIITG